MPQRIAILDSPDGELRDLVRAFASAAGAKATVERIDRADVLLARARAKALDLVVLDQEVGDGEQPGMALLGRLRALEPELPVVVVSERGNVTSAARAIAAGATDFLVRGEDLEERVETQLRKIHRVVSLLAENRTLRDAPAQPARIVGASPQVDAMLELIERIAPVPRPVLIRGERGTGKELVARAIHAASGCRGPFVVVNCAAFADSLLESELFGHERGAYTGAEKKVLGKFELASGGTLFLDEIGNMTLAFQQKVLRVVEYGTLVRVGGTAEVSVRTRLLAATNADLETMMSAGDFLRDLYDRLAFEVISVPPLRERKGDIALLAAHFFEAFMREVPAFSGKCLSAEAISMLEEYRFPGNVRELKHIIERAVYRDRTREVTAEDIGLLPDCEQTEDAEVSNGDSPGTFHERIAERERALLREALGAADSQADAARRLGMPYHQLRYYRKKHGL